MKKEFLPYYVSRGVLSAAFAILVIGISWKALLMAIVFFGLFLLYLHSGWFQIDLTYPLAPLRRDARGNLIQRKALIIAIGLSFLIFLFSSQLSAYFGLMLIGGNVLFAVAILTYFVAQFALFVRA